MAGATGPATPESAARDAEALVTELDGLDILVLCAGHNVVTPYDQITADEWGTVLSANLTCAFFALQAMTPAIRPGGSVVTVASVAAHTGAPHHMHYAAQRRDWSTSRSRWPVSWRRRCVSTASHPASH
jgi:3-oxoacyl-[acyl-carrier protein] reductase